MDVFACGQIDIGNAASAMTKKMGKGVLQADGTYETEPTIDVKAVADIVVYMASLPLDANVPFMTVMANQMPYMEGAKKSLHFYYSNPVSIVPVYTL